MQFVRLIARAARGEVTSFPKTPPSCAKRDAEPTSFHQCRTLTAESPFPALRYSTVAHCSDKATNYYIASQSIRSPSYISYRLSAVKAFAANFGFQADISGPWAGTGPPGGPGE